MNGFTEHQASDASETPGRPDVVLTWATAQNMLPLIRQIVADIQEHHQRLQRCRPEKQRLDRQRHSLAWPERARRYQLGEEIVSAEEHLKVACGELDGLGVALLDPEQGQVGFPTIVNNRRAFFSWRPGEEGVQFWHFAESLTRRPVPEAWKEMTEKKKPSKRKSGPRR